MDKVDAYISKKVQYGESDLILHLITKEMGKISAIARGARRSKKRFEAGLSNYILYSCSLGHQNRSNLFLLKETSIVKSFQFLLNSYRRISTAAYATELTALFMPENQEEPLLFEFLNHNYHLLDNPDFSPAVLVPRIMYKILELAGFPPQLDRCIHCNSLMPDTGARWGFDNNQGGVVCPDCGDLKPIVGINELKWLVAEVDELKNRRINRREYNNIYNLLSSFIRYTTRQWLVSEKFLIF
ncbi:MAG: DNA repair protein RecO [Deltaproteobacteria bacterium]|jgi:DNA repair protein RecO (recombination protein O)|nr:DNA repair protein RecO [Deltaproteobacteria bacterium]